MTAPLVHAAAADSAANTGEAPAPRAVGPRRELLGRYAAVFGAAWSQRKALNGTRRERDEAAFLPAALSLQETPVHPAPRRLAWALMALFVIALVWATFGQIDIVAVAPGRIVVDERTKTIQPLERSVVKRVLVKDGQRVQAGEPLIELDPTAARADNASLAEQVAAAESELLRARELLRLLLKTEHSRSISPGLSADSASSQGIPGSTRVQLAAEWADIQARTAKLAAERQRRVSEIATAEAVVAKLETTLPLSRQREDDFKRLADQGFMAGHMGQDRARERIELERDLATQRARRQEAQAALAETQGAEAAYRAETIRSLRERETQATLKLTQARQESAKAAYRERLTTLTAPVAGTVQQLAVHTAGGVATEAQVLMVIVPEGAAVSAEVVLENKDIGYVQAGQAAEIKLETFPFTRYGTVAAEVKRVTQDAVTDEKRGAIFPASLALKARTIDVDGKPVALSPGMNVTAEIKTGKRRVIEYLMSPVQKAGRESLRER